MSKVLVDRELLERVVALLEWDGMDDTTPLEFGAKCDSLCKELSDYIAQPDPWAPSKTEYDRAIHCNPDAKAWADLFVETFPGLADKHDLMIGWFANAMMAMHDHLARKTAPQQEQSGLVEWVVDRWHAEVANRPLVNVHRRTLDSTWRQMIRHLGEDDVVLLGPRHDDMLDASGNPLPQYAAPSRRPPRSGED